MFAAINLLTRISHQDDEISVIARCLYLTICYYDLNIISEGTD